MILKEYSIIKSKNRKMLLQKYPQTSGNLQSNYITFVKLFIVLETIKESTQ